MNESKTRKIRQCWECGGKSLRTAAELMDHAKVCKRVKALGLEVPQIVLTDGDQQ